MKKTLILTIVLVAIIAVIYLVAKYNGPQKKVAGYDTGDPNAPKIEILEKRFDFGKIRLTDVVKHEFKIKNVGKDPLILSGIYTSCHCATAVVKIPGAVDSPSFGMHDMGGWQGELSAGGEGILEVTYEPAKHPAKGPISRVTYLKTNDPANSELQFEIVANIE